MKSLRPKKTKVHFKNIFSFLSRYLPKDKTIPVFIAAGLIGCAGALFVYFFRLAFADIRHLVDPHAHGMVDLAHDLPWWWRLALPVIGGACAGLLLQYVLHWVPHEGADDYLEAIRIGDGNMSIRQTIIKSGASLCSISSGASIGREGPMVQLAAMAGVMLGRLFKLSPNRQQLLVACGAVAGLASAYNAPIAGLLFVVEIAYGNLSRQTLMPLIVAAVMGMVVSHRIFGITPVYQIPHFTIISDWETLSFIGLGVVCGFAAPMFRYALRVSRKVFGRLGRSHLWTMALGGLGVGIISVIDSNVWGNGYSVVNSILHIDWTWKALLIVLLLKVLATSISYGSGALGGVFTPTLFVGTTLGALYGKILTALHMNPHHTIVSYAIVGMGAFLSSVTYATLMSILMIYELTLSYGTILPLMLACVIGHYIAQQFHEEGIYHHAH